MSTQTDTEATADWCATDGAVAICGTRMREHPRRSEGERYFCSRWAMEDHYHLVLANPRPLPSPIPATGRLGLWRPDDTLAAAITEQFADADRPGGVAP